MQAPLSISRRSGFTLIELVIVMAILVIVLTVTYRLILDCVDAERTIDKLTLPEKVGEGILTLIRGDLSGTLWRNMGMNVFYVTDSGEAPDAHDEIRFISTVEPTPREDLGRDSTVEVYELRTITGIAYYLRANQGTDNVPTSTLYRKEIVEFTTESPLDAPGQSYEVYDKVAYLSIKCYDSYDGVWYNDWASDQRIQLEQSDLLAAAAEGEGIQKVTKRSSQRQSSFATQNAPGVDPGTTDPTNLLPPAAVPSAVRIELGIYAGNGNRIERDLQGQPILKTYSTIVPILTAQRLQIEVEDESLMGEDGAGGLGDAEGGGAPDAQNQVNQPPGRGGPGKGFDRLQGPGPGRGPNQRGDGRGQRGGSLPRGGLGGRALPPPGGMPGGGSQPSPRR